MNKKVKSFTMDVEPYEALFKMFKENYVDVSISSFLNKAIKELLAYLQGIEGELKRSPELTVPMSYIIETVAREPFYKFLDEKVSEGMSVSPLQREALEHQRKYDVHIGKNPELAINYDINQIDKNVPIKTLIKYLTDGVISEIKRRGSLTDDEHIEKIRKAGGKGLHKKIREDIGPFMDKIDPPVNEVFKKLFNGKKNNDVK